MLTSWNGAKYGSVVNVYRGSPMNFSPRKNRNNSIFNRALKRTDLQFHEIIIVNSLIRNNSVKQSCAKITEHDVWKGVVLMPLPSNDIPAFWKVEWSSLWEIRAYALALPMWIAGMQSWEILNKVLRYHELTSVHIDTFIFIVLKSPIY